MGRYSADPFVERFAEYLIANGWVADPPSLQRGSAELVFDTSNVVEIYCESGGRVSNIVISAGSLRDKFGIDESDELYRRLGIEIEELLTR